MSTTGIYPHTERHIFLVLSYILDVIVMWEYATTWTKPVAPMRRPHTEKKPLSKYMLWIHIIAGLFQMIIGMFALLLPEEWTVTFALAHLALGLGLFIQVPTSFFFISSVAGIKTLMHPGYALVSLVHAWTAGSGVLRFYQTSAFPRDELEATLAVLHTYAWVRLFFWLLKNGVERRLSTTVIYTFSVVLAGLLTVPFAVGGKGNMILTAGWVAWGTFATQYGLYKKEPTVLVHGNPQTLGQRRRSKAGLPGSGLPPRHPPNLKIGFNRRGSRSRSQPPSPSKATAESPLRSAFSPTSASTRSTDTPASSTSAALSNTSTATTACMDSAVDVPSPYISTPNPQENIIYTNPTNLEDIV
ncbi:hypothetical protein DFS34DRAFT_600615 [Phlyctochytrium arcticum]|nr:hypothetical protein DFS34DRAFT_600615 [Phlyctochytrium arcticum]